MLPSERKHSIENKAVFISCIVPVYNEEAVIESFLKELSTHLDQLASQYEIVVVDDGSKDKTIEKILALPPQLKVKLLSLSRNFGKEAAMTAGLEFCRGEVVVLLDADFQHPVAVLSSFLQSWGEGYDMVYGIRQSRSSEAPFKRYFAQLFYWLMSRITHIDIPNNAGDFRLIDRKVVDALKQFPERNRFMKGLYAWIGFKKIGVPFEVQERAGGHSSWGLMRLFDLALAGITSFSDVPLRVWGLVGFVISLISLVYAIYLVTSTLLFGTDFPGFPTIVVAIVFLGGIQLLSIGILGEYIARIFTEVKQRPKYLIEHKYGFEE
ncbi:MAG TPA: glycosyltransferase family 2 protein [Gammaproteobacteria bacterium]|nr:glycosyltransferase family 2 protein [Gammaproteobacteria bacterium]